MPIRRIISNYIEYGAPITRAYVTANPIEVVESESEKCGNSPTQFTSRSPSSIVPGIPESLSASASIVPGITVNSRMHIITHTHFHIQ